VTPDPNLNWPENVLLESLAMEKPQVSSIRLCSLHTRSMD